MGHVLFGLGHVLFGFSGRINRATWWVTVLVPLIAMSLMAKLTADLGLNLGVIQDVAVWIILVWIWSTAGAKRLHDLDRTGAWVVLFVGSPFALVGITFIAHAAAHGVADRIGIAAVAIAFLIYFAIQIWSLIWLGCLPETVGPNRYGPDPLGGKALSTAPPFPPSRSA